MWLTLFEAKSAACCGIAGEFRKSRSHADQGKCIKECHAEATPTAANKDRGCSKRKLIFTEFDLHTYGYKISTTMHNIGIFYAQ